jgi:aldose 1-epimerase
MSIGGNMAAVASGTQWTITWGDHEAVIVEVGGGLRAYTVAGVEVVDGYREDEFSPASHGQILAPWPNRIRDGRYAFGGDSYQLSLTEPARHNAIHGLVNWVRWHQVGEATEDSVTVEYALPPEPGYPWALSLRTTWTMGPGGLRSEQQVINESATPCPFGFSVHPYLVVPGVPVAELSVHVPARNRLLVDGRLLPIGAARVAGTEFDFTQPRKLGDAQLDMAFGDVIRDSDGGSAVTLSASDGRGVKVWADPSFGWWQVFTSDTLPGARHRRAVAIEPMTCPPDAFRSGRDLVTLEPAQTWQATWGISPSSPSI